MRIADLMKLIPDDGTLALTNNSGDVIIEVKYYGLRCESMFPMEEIDNKIENEISVIVNKILTHDK